MTVVREGATLSRTVDHARGGGSRSFDGSWFREKYDSPVAPVLGASAGREASSALSSTGSLLDSDLPADTYRHEATIER